MTTKVQIINYGPLPVMVKTVSPAGENEFQSSQEVPPGDTSKGWLFVHRGMQVEVSEVNPS